MPVWVLYGYCVRKGYLRTLSQGSYRKEGAPLRTAALELFFDAFGYVAIDPLLLATHQEYQRRTRSCKTVVCRRRCHIQSLSFCLILVWKWHVLWKFPTCEVAICSQNAILQACLAFLNVVPKYKNGFVL